MEIDPARLRWPSAGGRRSYRLIIRGAAADDLLKLEVEGTEATVDPGPVARSSPPVWRVQYADGDGGWTDYLPYMSWPLRPSGPTTELTWGDDPAPAHRIVIHDDTTGETVLKAATTAGSHLVDWSTLDATHQYRWRTQSWVDGEWAELTPYRPLDPPAEVARELLVNRDPPSAGAQLCAAYEKLDSGDPAGALRELDSLQGGGDPVAESIRLVARGLEHERSGEREQAVTCFDAAYELGVPLPALLRACGRHYRRVMSYGRAYQCFSLLEQLEPGALEELTRGLRRSEATRHSPALVPKLLAGDRPRFYALRPVKQAIADHLGEDGAALVLGEMIGRGASWSARRLPLAGLLETAGERALDFEELVAPAEVRMSAPPVFGGGEANEINGRCRSFFFCVLPDMVVSSKSDLLLAEDRVVMDHQGDELERVPTDLDVDPIVLGVHGAELTVLSRDEEGAEHDLDRAFPLVGVHTYNFGHWIFEQMFKVWAVLDRPEFRSVPLVVDKQMPPQLREVLEAFVGPDHPIVTLAPGASVRVRELWTCSTIAYWPAGDRPGSTPGAEAELADTAALAEIVERANSRLVGLSGRRRGRRIYLTRSGSRLVNRTEVEAWFGDNGFEVVDYSQLSFAEQVRTTRSADVIVAEDGSSIYGMLFAEPGTRIGVLTVPPPREYEWCNEMFRSLGHSLLLLAGEIVKENPVYANMSDFRIDLEQLPRFVEALGHVEIADDKRVVSEHDGTPRDGARVPTIVITGPPGVGKSTVLNEVSSLCSALGIAHAGIEADLARWIDPAPKDLGELLRRNVEILWENYRSAGATHLIVTDVVRSSAELERLTSAIPNSDPVLFRLRADIGTIRSRLVQRELGGREEQFHLRVAGYLFQQMEKTRSEDHVIETEDREIREIAEEIVDLAGWGRGG